MSAKTQAMFSDISGSYDRLNHLFSMNQDLQWRKDSVRQLTAGGFVPKNVLDLCAGTGDFALAVREQLPSARVTLADFAQPMLSLAKQKIKAQAGFDLMVADALRLPFQDYVFDAVVCGFGVRNLDSLEAGLREIARVLKPGGRAVILEFFKPMNPLLGLFYGLYVGGVMPLVGGAVSKNLEAYTYLPRSAKNFVSAEEFKGLMEKCGFKEVRSENRTLGIAVSTLGIRK